MKKLILVLGLVVVAIAGCTNADAQTGGGACATDCATMQYVGNSPTEYNGRQGLYIYYGVCQSEFGPNHASDPGSILGRSTVNKISLCVHMR